MKSATALVIAAFALAASGPAMAKPCFRTNDMRNHKIIDDHTLYTKVGRDVWRIGVKGNCLAGAMSSDPLVIKTTASNGMVCTPLDLDLSVKRGGGIATACIVDGVTKLTPAEISAIPKGKKP